MPSNSSTRRRGTKTQRPNNNISIRSNGRNSQHATSVGLPIAATADFRARTMCTVPRGMQFFPDTFNCCSKTVIGLGLSGSVASQHTYHLNSPAYQFGPQVNWTGAFATNVPAGISYLLSSNASGGSVAPYFYCTTHAIDFEIECINIQTISAYVTVVVSYDPSLSTMTQSQISEQRGAVQILVPPSNSTIPYKIRGLYNLSEILGVAHTEVLNDVQYRQPAGSLPAQSIYLHVIVASVDGSTTCAMQTRQSFTFWHKFTVANNFVTTVPA
jgi:hypothetical protein